MGAPGSTQRTRKFLGHWSRVTKMQHHHLDLMAGERKFLAEGGVIAVEINQWRAFGHFIKV